jgi:hypothetical protein
LLVIDLARADAPWIVYWNYKQKYADNPVIEFLKQQNVQGRVTAELAPLSRQFLINNNGSNFPALYFEWLQNHFQYYRVQSLDIIQMPHMPELDKLIWYSIR